ncbi:MAG: hypothetical protein WCI23_04940 [Chlorobiaceae bacterium]
MVGAGVFAVASSDGVGEMAAGGGINVADKAFLVTCGAWVFCADLLECVAVWHQQKPPVTRLHAVTGVTFCFFCCWDGGVT